MLVGGGGGGGAPAAGGAAAAAAAPAAEVKEKEAFDVKLGAVDAKAKIKVIKEVRAITGLGLKEAKELVEKAPVVIKAGVKKEEAEQIKKVITDAGGAVEVI
jgi:large subunit ribosomal protein L7/L12